jgi:hypothetical protein
MVAIAALTAFTATSAPAATDLAEDAASATSPIEVLGDPVPSANASAPTTINELRQPRSISRGTSSMRTAPSSPRNKPRLVAASGRMFPNATRPRQRI